MTGYPWATGDALLAADLNAAFANGVAVGGPFLPLSGGSVTGQTTFTHQVTGPTLLLSGNNTLLSNSSGRGWLDLHGFIGGSPSVQTQPVYINIQDKILGTGAQPQLGINVVHNIAPNANAATGNRITFNVAQTAVGANQGGSYSYSGINQAAQFTVFNACNVGGTSGTPQGSSTAVGITSTVQTGATFYAGNAAMEIDLATETGASAQDENALLIVHTGNHKTQATRTSNAIVITDQGGVTARWMTGLLFGAPTAQWPIDVTSGAMIRGSLSVAAVATGAQFGFDALQVGFPSFNTTSRGGFLASNGFAVDGVGAVQIGTAYATPSATGLALDCKGIVGTGTPTVAAGGVNYAVGDILFDPWGGVYRVATVSAGAVATVTVYADGNGASRQPNYPVAAAPANPVATTRWFSSVGSGCTLNISWNTTAIGLSLNPTGQRIGFNGTAPVAKPTVSGAKGSNAALASLMTALAAYGLVTDTTTA